MKRGFALLLSIGTLVPIAAPAQAGPPHRSSPPPQRSRYYGPQQRHSSHHHHHGGDGWFAFGLGMIFGAAVEAVTEPPPPPPPPIVVYPPPPGVYGPPPPPDSEPQAYAGPEDGSARVVQGAPGPYGGPPPAPWPSALTPTGDGAYDVRASRAPMPQGAPVGPESAADQGSPALDAQRVYVPPQVVWHEERVVVPAQYSVRPVPVYEDVSVPVYMDRMENGVVKKVLVGSRLERRQVGTREERVVVRPETVRIEHVSETIPGRWAYVPADAISDLPPSR